MGIKKIADGAYFVPTYSLQTITPAFETGTTLQGLSAGEEPSDESELVDENEAEIETA